MSVDYKIKAEPRSNLGKSASRRYRTENKVPVVLYGAGKDNLSLLVDHNEISHNLEAEGFRASIIEIDTGNGVEQAILRDVQLHPHKPKVVHVDFQRISATEKLHMAVPLHLLGSEEAPGVAEEDGIMSLIMTDVDIQCLPKDLPEYLEVDVSHLHVHESVNLTDIKLPEGVEITALMHDGEDTAVATVMVPQLEVEEEPEEGEEEVEGFEDEEDSEAEEASSEDSDES